MTSKSRKNLQGSDKIVHKGHAATVEQRSEIFAEAGGGVPFRVSPHVVALEVIQDWRGKLCVLEKGTGLPFPIRRVYFLYDVPTGSERGGHAHHELQQYLIAISGSFTVDVVTPEGAVSHHLSRPDQALHIGPYTWREIHSFSSNAVCLVLASQEYSESDYIRNRADFDRIVGISV